MLIGGEGEREWQRETPSSLTLSNAGTECHIPTATHMLTPTCMCTHKRTCMHTLIFQFNCTYIHAPLVLLQEDHFPPERRRLQTRTTLPTRLRKQSNNSFFLKAEEPSITAPSSQLFVKTHYHFVSSLASHAINFCVCNFFGNETSSS